MELYEVYKSFAEKKGFTVYRVAKDIGVTRSTIGRVFCGEQGIGSKVVLGFYYTYGFIPEGFDDEIEKIVGRPVKKFSASPDGKAMPRVMDVISNVESGVEERIRIAFSGKGLPQTMDEFIDLMKKSWATGVKDGVEYCAQVIRG